MSKLLFAGSRTDSVLQLSGTISDIAQADGSYYIVDTEWVDAGINTAEGFAQGIFTDPSSAPILTQYSVTASHTLYFHCQFGCSVGYFSLGNSPVIFFNDSSGSAWVRIKNNGQIQYNSGTTISPVWTNIGPAAGPIGPEDDFSDIDIRIDVRPSGNHRVTLLYNQAIVAGPYVFSQTLMTELSSFSLGPGVGNYDCAWSQIICTEDISSVGGHVAVARATGPGANSQWSGSYSDINQSITTFSTYNQASEPDLTQSYPMGSVSVPQGSFISGIFNWIQVKNSGIPPENVSSVIRTSANINHTSAITGPVDIGWGQTGARYDVDPDTGSQWTQSSWNSPVQLGFRSEI